MRICNLTPGYLFMWQDDYRIVEHKTPYGSYYTYQEPSGAFGITLSDECFVHLHEVLHIIAKEQGKKDLCFSTVPEEHLDAVLSEIEGVAILSTDRRNDDYLYLADDLRLYQGKKYDAKRNHIHAFLREHATYSVQELCQDNHDKVLSFYKHYQENVATVSPSEKREAMAAEKLLIHFQEVGVSGLVLEDSGEILGFSLFEKQGDTLFVHVEKAVANVRGAYPLLVQEEAKFFADVQYINREEDDGDAGLRRAKESLHPVKKLRKYDLEFLV